MKYLLKILFCFSFISNTYSQSLDWVNNAGSQNNGEWIEASCKDSSNNIYSFGFFRDTLRFNNSSDVFVSHGDYDLFLLKNDANGNYISCLQIGGYHMEFPNDIEYDESGYLYLGGYLSDSVYLNNGTSSQLIYVDSNYNYGRNGFLLKLDLNYNLQWSQFFENDFNVFINDIEIDNSSNIFLAGTYEDSLDFGPNNSSHNLGSVNYYNHGFVAKFNNAGSLIKATSLHGSHEVQTEELEVYGNNIILTGYFRGTMDADPTAGIFNLQELTGSDIFIASLGKDFTFNWAKKIASTTRIQYHTLVGKDGYYYMGGGFLDTTYFDSNNLNSYKTTNGQWDCFLLRFNSSGDINWVKQIGNSFYDYINGIDINSQNKVYISGIYESSVDFNPDTGTFIMNSFQNTRDIFIAEFDTNGTFNWSKSIGGSGLDDSRSIICTDNNLYVTGLFENTVDFDFNSSQVLRTSFGVTDGFILNVNLNNITSLNEKGKNQLESKLYLYPNPSTDFLNIKGNLSQIDSFEIYDLKGKQVSKIYYDSKIDISSLPAGIFLLNSVYKDGSVHSFKFIKTK